MALPPRDSENEVPHAEVTRRVLEKLKRMTPEEAKASLVRSGIITVSGELTKPYRYDPERAHRHS